MPHVLTLIVAALFKVGPRGRLHPVAVAASTGIALARLGVAGPFWSGCGYFGEEPSWPRYPHLYPTQGYCAHLNRLPPPNIHPLSIGGQIIV